MKTIRCKLCHKEVKYVNNRKYCKDCKKEMDKLSHRRWYNKKKLDKGVNPRREYFEEYGAKRGNPNEKQVKEWIKEIFPNDRWEDNNRTILKNPQTGYSLEIDMYNKTKNIAIEIQGIHHYEPIRGKEKLEYAQQIDEIKLEVATAMDLPLLQLDIYNVEATEKYVKAKVLEFVGQAIVMV